jgi:uncharacterized small protein (DUF1192 family)
MPLDKFINEFVFDPETFNVDEFKARALSEYQEDLSIRDAKVGEVNESSAKQQAEIQRLKALNYDLLMKKPGDPAETKTPGQTNGSENDETEVPVESLFGKRE